MNGVDMGIAIIPGVLVVCTMVMLLTNGVGPEGVYRRHLSRRSFPNLGGREVVLHPFTPLFGFSDPAAISVPITALGAAGAAVGIANNLAETGAANGNDLAVFTATCMCWSGYLSTHIAMMDTLGTKEATGPAILSHTIAGLLAGCATHFINMFVG